LQHPIAARAIDEAGYNPLTVRAKLREHNSVFMLSWAPPTALPLAASHTRAVISAEAVTICLPSGAKLG